MNKKTLIGIFSHSTANHLVERHWPYWKLAGADLWGIGRTDTNCIWPEKEMKFIGSIGKEGYVNGDNLCRRLVDAMTLFSLGPTFADYTDLCLIESDAIFTRKIPEHPGGLVTHTAGGGSDGMKSTRYFHTPWWVDRPTASKIVYAGLSLLKKGEIEQGFPDRFLGLICDLDNTIEVTEAHAFSVNALDTDMRMHLARCALSSAAWYIHGIKTEDQLQRLTEGFMVLP